MSLLSKIRSRSEWQAFLLSVVVLLVNRFLELGLTEADIYAMFTGAAGYAVSRGLAKYEAHTEETVPDDSDSADDPEDASHGHAEG